LLSRSSTPGSVVSRIDRDRCSRHALSVGVEDQLQAADGTAVNNVPSRRFVASRGELLADRRAAGRALPGHQGILDRYLPYR